MGIVAYSLLWAMQDLYHQPYFPLSAPTTGEKAYSSIGKHPSQSPEI